jgi:hypothetical protein
LDSYFVGVDAGAKGAVAILDLRGEVVQLARFDNDRPTRVLNEVLSSYDPRRLDIALEAVHAMPGQGVCSTFTFGVGYGRIMGWFEAKGLKFELHSPQAWQRYLPLGIDPKARVRAYAAGQWGLERFVMENCRVAHQGAMDAACIAEYLRRLRYGLVEAPRARPKGAKLRVLKL